MNATRKKGKERESSPLTPVSTSEKHEVLSRSFTDESDLSSPRTSTTVRATRHTHRDRIISKTRFLHNLLDLFDEQRKVL